jgi:hypothetical protein
MPEKSGMDAVPCVLLFAVPTSRATVCANAGVVTAAANATNKRSFRRCIFITFLPFMACRFSGVNADTDGTDDSIFRLESCPPTAPTLPLIGGTTAGPAGSSAIKQS